MNKVILKGNLCRDPEVRTTGGGTPVCNTAIAVSRKVKRDGQWTEETTFVDLAIWSKRGEAFAKYHSKGDPALVEGRLHLDTWDDKNGGGKRSKLKVVVEDWEFVGGKKSGDAQEAPDDDSGDRGIDVDDTPF